MPERRLSLLQQIAQTEQEIARSDAHVRYLVDGVRRTARHFFHEHGKVLAIGTVAVAVGGMLFFPRHLVTVGKQFGGALLNAAWTTGLPWLMDPGPEGPPSP